MPPNFDFRPASDFGAPLTKVDFQRCTVPSTMPREDIEENLPPTNEGYGTHEYWYVYA